MHGYNTNKHKCSYYPRYIHMSEIVAALQALIIVQMLNYACCQVLVDHNF